MDPTTINNALVVIKEFLDTEQGLTIACFVACLSSLRKKTLIDQPIGSVFSGIIGAGITSRIFNWITPITLRSYATAGIFGLSILGFICKIFTRDLPEPPTSTSLKTKTSKYSDTILGCPFVKLTYKNSSIPPYSSSQTSPSPLSSSTLTTSSASVTDMYRVSYSVHNKLENEGKSLTCEGVLTTDKILMLFNQECYSDSVIIKNVEMIRKILDNMDLSQTNGVFIHGRERGYMMITSNSVDTNCVVSINID